MTNVRLSRRGLVRGAVLLSALRQLGCAEQSPGTPGSVRGASTNEDANENPNEGGVTQGDSTCAEVPAAWVLGGDAEAAELLQWLQGMRISAQALPLDQSPIDLKGLIVIPSFATDNPVYAAYISEYAEHLRSFVDNANVLLELRQRTESEPAPPFLPSGYGVSRQDIVVSGVQVQNAENPVLRALESNEGLLDWTEPEEGTPVFIGADGFEVLLADPVDGHALLIEAHYGQGRFLLSALAFDRPASDAQSSLSRVLLENLSDYVRSVCARTARAVRLKPSPPSTAFSEGSSMLVALPDTQYYALRYPGLFYAQTSWIREQAGARDVKYVLHLGDIVHNNTQQEWQRASAAMGQLHGVVPYALAPGNHDYGPSGDATTRETLLNEHFRFGLSADMPTFGEAYQVDQLDNSYHLFSIQGRDFVVIALEWSPRDEVVAWADEVMSRYPDRQGILITHAYLNNNDWRYDHTDTVHSQRFSPYRYETPGSKNDGEQLWQKLVRRHRFAMTLNGHVLGDGCAYLASVTDHGNVCHQMLSNYQMRDQGGEGYMRLLEFLDDGRTVKVFTYSPLYDQFLDEPGHNFSITLD